MASLNIPNLPEEILCKIIEMVGAIHSTILVVFLGWETRLCTCPRTLRLKEV
uniref:F-box domain-containing protein n=1 Tax=Brassica oleracea TaxID=3712 RepID=A0A3P6G822_BRAOL|nr:unnamed protein product [Brassica oleracea]